MKKNKFTTLILCTATALFLVIASCKKGKEDPSFTLLSRKTRVSGNWTLKSGTLDIGVKDSTGARNGLAYTFANSTYHFDNLGRGIHSDGTSELKITFNKKGEFTLQQTIDGLNIQATGTWNFLGKDRTYKNKERIDLQLTEINDSNWLNAFNMSLTNFSYSIKELKNKEMILVADQQSIIVDQSGASEYVTAEYTFVQ